MERYTKEGDGDTSKLTDILNDYISAMVEEILTNNGDVLKFSGDAFIVMWKSTKDVGMSEITYAAINTACVIQTCFGRFDTDVGVTLQGTYMNLNQFIGKFYLKKGLYDQLKLFYENS